MGSLSDLSYALAATEQDFIAPENIQALVWKELVPDLLVSATLPRWWAVTPSELHAAALYQKAGEEILVLAEKDATARGQVIDILWDRMAPRRLEQTLQYLTQGEDPTALLPRMLPSETFHLAAEFRKQYPAAASAAGPGAA